MLSIEKINTRNTSEVKRFIDIPLRLYKNDPNWVPPFRDDVSMMLNKDKHPFYEHSIADFFILSRDGQDIGRIAAMENQSYNQYHQKKPGYVLTCLNARMMLKLLICSLKPPLVGPGNGA